MLVERFDFTPLEEKAASLREVLLEKGWTGLSSDAKKIAFPSR